MMAGDGTARWPRVTEIASDGCSEYVQYSGEQLNRTNY
jgi:hypothetical protein